MEDAEDVVIDLRMSVCLEVEGRAESEHDVEQAKELGPEGAGEDWVPVVDM
jgi:hypothetical protein